MGEGIYFVIIYRTLCALQGPIPPTPQPLPSYPSITSIKKPFPHHLPVLLLSEDGKLGYVPARGQCVTLENHPTGEEEGGGATVPGLECADIVAEEAAGVL